MTMIVVGETWHTNFSQYTVMATDGKYVIYKDQYGDVRETTCQAFEAFIIEQSTSSRRKLYFHYEE